MNVKQQLRCAALISWFELTTDRETQTRITNELWCLRNDVDTTALSDITHADIETNDIVRYTLNVTDRTFNEQVAFLLCTFEAIS